MNNQTEGTVGGRMATGKSMGVMAAVVAFGAGATAMIGAEFLPGEATTHVWRAGLVVVIVGALALVLQKLHLGDAFIERVRQQAWDEGYAEGESAAHTVKLYPLRLSGGVVPGADSPQQLEEEIRLGGEA